MHTTSQKGIIYCRVSSQEQVRGTSLESQKSACLEYAERQGIKIVETFIERGESATAADRTQLIKALEYCRTHQGGLMAFIVWKVDRFARNTTDHFALRAQLGKYKVRLYSVTEPITDDPMGKMMETILAGVAQLENDTRKQRCEGGMQGRIASGIRPWMPPIGYMNSKQRVDKKKTVPDVADPERFYLVQKGLRAYTTGEHSITGLANLFNEWGLRSRTGKPIRKQLVARMLTDKFYAGFLTNPWTGREHRGQHQPMITENEYGQIQRVKMGFSNHATRPRSVLNPDFPLRRLILCMCKKGLTGSWHKGRDKKYAIYSCHNRSCIHCGHTITKETLENKFIELLGTITPHEHFLKLFEAIMLDVWKNQYATHIQEQQQHEKEIKRLESRREQLIQMRLDGEITKEESGRIRDSLTSQIVSMRGLINEKQTDGFDMETALPVALRFACNIAGLWNDMGDVRQKQRLQKLVLPESVVYDKTAGTFGTAVLSPIFSLNRQFVSGKSELVAGAGIAPAVSRL